MTPAEARQSQHVLAFGKSTSPSSKAAIWCSDDTDYCANDLAIPRRKGH
ncbi:unnamed protein product [Chondrus crispus]|uniref:Uncharacterized protein n=1 Tax=Chondrus crispus TaxID=2769 RepID=R7QGY5_CHOCR|nr:unnamed protein product [Chondrus crispus]CDF36685.1 unnamed protein product [Chondrus crispus]|eukprot:XP_005716504.1 unnamed protein product [Chondrus crispus]